MPDIQAMSWPRPAASRSAADTAGSAGSEITKPAGTGNPAATAASRGDRVASPHALAAAEVTAEAMADGSEETGPMEVLR